MMHNIILSASCRRLLHFLNRNTHKRMLRVSSFILIWTRFSSSLAAHYCDCDLIEVSSNGGALQHQPSYLGQFSFSYFTVQTFSPGTYQLEGLVGEQQAPYYRSENSKYLSINIYSDETYSWIVSDR